MNDLKIEFVHFDECTFITANDNNQNIFNIIKFQDNSNEKYCKSLINKILEINITQVDSFIKHHLSLVESKLKWLNSFEELILVNRIVFKKNKGLLIKISTSIEIIRCSVSKSGFCNCEITLDSKFINAKSDDRVFSFHKTLKELNNIQDYGQKIIFLTNERFEYEQTNIDFVNTKLPDYGSQCLKSIEQIQHLRSLTFELNEGQSEYFKNSSDYKKLKFNGNVNQLVDIFYQLSRELYVNGQPLIDGNINDIAKVIVNSFTDKKGNNLSIDTVKTILTPSREDKRPNNNKRIDIDKLI